MSVTNKFGWTMPTVGAHKNVWGQILNEMFDDMDQNIQRLTAVGSTAPASPSTGDLWVDASGAPTLVLKLWDGDSWETLTGSGASNLGGLSDVGVSTPTDGNILAADGTDFDSKTPDNAGLVAKTGAQTIDGVKTFGSFPVTPSSAPTTDYQAANKKYVDDNGGGGGFDEYTGSQNNMEEDDEITITHPSETAYDSRIVNFVREVLGDEANWSSLDFDTGDESDFLQGDVKGTAVNFQLDTLGAQTGHFEDSGNSPVTIGSGNIEDRIQAGCRFYCDDTWFEIVSITDAGEADDEVEISLQDGSATSLAEGTYAVSYVYGTEFDAGKVLLNKMESEYSSDICTGGTASSYSSMSDPTYAAPKAFDDNAGTEWRSNNAPTVGDPDWLKYDFGVGNEKTPKRYRMRARNTSQMGFPRDFNFQGSNNNSDWDDLDTQVSISDPGIGAWGSWYEFSNSTPYRYMRLYITDQNSSYAYVVIAEMEICEQDMAYSIDQFYVVATTDSNQANTTDWENLKLAIITEELNSQSIFYAFSFDGRTTWGIWDGTGGDDGWRPIARLNTTTWQFNSNTTAGATDVTWADAATFGENSQESAFEQAFQVTSNQMTGTEVNAIADAQWNDQTEGMTGFSTSVTSLNVAWGMKTTSATTTPELDAVVVTYEAPTKWEPIVPNDDWAIEMYSTSTKLIKLGTGTESVVKGRVRIPA